ncbi:GTP cyclohydrolase II [Mesorhizobium robiniae]|uniref:GTP cyclohydrolase II n=1 Tax=Mesorhizobium robiniae TaxID=559315 RepID=A0ABV2GZX7_9HYPH|nr:hypothetical protein [Mesorhizobium sp. ZC-5]MCV3243987.1 hypothetical protein [Mesorhizobium sp. ZC-5]
MSSLHDTVGGYPFDLKGNTLESGDAVAGQHLCSVRVRQATMARGLGEGMVLSLRQKDRFNPLLSSQMAWRLQHTLEPTKAQRKLRATHGQQATFQTSA